MVSCQTAVLLPGLPPGAAVSARAESMAFLRLVSWNQKHDAKTQVRATVYSPKDPRGIKRLAETTGLHPWSYVHVFSLGLMEIGKNFAALPPRLEARRCTTALKGL